MRSSHEHSRGRRVSRCPTISRTPPGAKYRVMSEAGPRSWRGPVPSFRHERNRLRGGCHRPAPRAPACRAKRGGQRPSTKPSLCLSAPAPSRPGRGRWLAGERELLRSTPSCRPQPRNATLCLSSLLSWREPRGARAVYSAAGVGRSRRFHASASQRSKLSGGQSRSRARSRKNSDELSAKSTSAAV
jgi:hypothetical protein